MTTKVLSVGGSMIAPDKPDVDFLAAFVKMASDWLAQDSSRRLILVAGGGAPARVYQNAYKDVCAATARETQNEAADWIGVMATRINAQLLKASFGSLCQNDVVTNPTADIDFKGQVLVASGWKPGFSSDNDAVLLAEKFGADTVVNLSNIEKVYTDDPRKNPDAKPKMCFIGCPHLTRSELCGWINKIYDALKKNNHSKPVIPTVLTSAPGVLKSIEGTEEERRAKEIGLTISYICPLMYCDNPLVHSTPIITNSNKLRTYTSCRFYEDDRILPIICGGGK